MKVSLGRIAAASAAALSVLVLAPVARGIDVDRDGYHDFLLREQPYLPYANVGANCDVFKWNGVWYGRLTIRPPRVWGLSALGRQQVAWRTRFYDRQSGKVVWTNAWVYDRVRPGQATDFGGGPNAPQVMITWNQYWVGGQWYQHPISDNGRIKAIVDAGWYNRRRKRWVVRSLRVLWLISTVGRTTGVGQTGPASTPVTSWTC